MHRFALLLALLPALAVLAADEKPYEPKVAPASDEPARAAKKIRVPKGMTIDVWAAEPHLANPVAFCIDHKNRFYVAETFRLHQGVTDIRGHLKKAGRLDDDLACRTVEDRVAMMKRWYGKSFPDNHVHHDRIRLIEDTTGKGKADRAVVFADGFNRPEDGIGSGLLARGDTVWYTNIPTLWQLRDTKGDGKATERKALHSGYGVHFGFIGHDMHGLVMGPDGKIYFSIGDRGLNVKTKDRHLFYPDTGAVLRCNPDGSELEAFATGLRNPQELAFDDHGNLFTCDNNSDSGDRARWTFLVEGGDCGWRIGYQHDGVQGSRGPWNAEKLWHPPHAGQPAWHVPCIINLSDGPSGLVYYTGLGLPERYKGHFFLADFRGVPNGSGIRSFANKPKGAGFELTDSHEFLWNVLATDVDFGTDGAMYVSDWVSGWGLTGKGRLWKVSDPDGLKDPAVVQAKMLLAEGFEKRESAELKKLLGHADRRVRQEAQFALAARGKDSVEPLTAVAREGKSVLARLHALWGLGQIARSNAGALDGVRKLLDDKEAEVRSQAAKVLGDAKDKEASEKVAALLKDAEPRVRLFAAQALGKIGDRNAVPAIVAMARDNDDKDVYLRHAAVRALAGCADDKALAEAAKSEVVSVRRVALLAHRQLGKVEIGRFLDDADPEIVTEAARAINDAPIEGATAKLASLIERRGMSEALGYRVLNANFRQGKAENAKALARFAARSGEKEGLRVEAVRELDLWARPPGRDRIMGVWRPLPERPQEDALAAFRASMGGLFTGPSAVRKEAARVAVKFGIKDVGPALFATVADEKQPAIVRAETLLALQALKDERLEKAVELALGGKEPRLRAAGRRVLVATKPAEGLLSLADALDKGETIEKQEAFDVLGGVKGDDAERLLLKWLERLVAGKVPAEVRLDLVEAAEQSTADAVKKKLAEYEKARPKEEPFGRWRDSMNGGDVEAGRRVFLHKAETSCLRCHKAGAEGSGEVGPDLTGIGAQQKRDYLLEAVVFPNKQIAKGYESVELVLDNGKTVSGILKAEDDKEVRLMNPEGAIVVVKKARIDERRRGKSAMPEDLTKYLTRKEMRDLVEFLASLNQPKK